MYPSLATLLIWLIVPLSVSGQQSYAAVDGFVDQLAATTSTSISVDRLAHALTDAFPGERQKVRAIFYWVATNVSYDVKRYRSRKRGKSIKYRSQAELIRKQDRLLQKRIRRTLRRRAGICQDYAELFTALCTAAGISCETVNGQTKKSPYQIGRSRAGTNHAWNIVRVNGQRYPVDATWASGYTDRKVTRFTRSFDDAYFLADPGKFIYSHYPEFDRHQLLRIKVSKETYTQFPVVTSAYLAAPIASLSSNTELVADSLVCVRLGIRSAQETMTVRLTDRRGALPTETKHDDGEVRVCTPQSEVTPGPVQVLVSMNAHSPYIPVGTYLKRKPVIQSR